MKKIHITSLGCPKNLVDSEVLTGQLKKRKYELTNKPEEAELIIVNTCGFIDAAKSESIQAIFEAVELKKEQKTKQVYVTGCLSQRYKEELANEIPEIDAIFGTEDYKNILSRLGEEHFQTQGMYQMRELTTPAHFSYLKISEGCNHTCAFCAIPNIRGDHRSRSIDDILAEARILANKGVKELILVSQDTSYYGKDLYDKSKIIDLLQKLADEDLFKWIRPMYWYPSNFPMQFIDLINNYESIIPYLDMPIQHASNRILELMRRAEKGEKLKKLYQDIRNKRPDIALRTSLIVGHPGETDQDFQILKDFVKEMRYDRLGVFVYSDEEGTASFNIGEKVSKGLAENRRSELMELQKQISTEINKQYLDSTQVVLIDAYNHNENCYYGRTYRDAPEIDNEVIIPDENYNKDYIGSFRRVLITDALEYELYGSFIVNLNKE